jgi:hypothetical protein
MNFSADFLNFPAAQVTQEELQSFSDYMRQLTSQTGIPMETSSCNGRNQCTSRHQPAISRHQPATSRQQTMFRHEQPTATRQTGNEGFPMFRRERPTATRQTGPFEQFGNEGFPMFRRERQTGPFEQCGNENCSMFRRKQPTASRQAGSFEQCGNESSPMFKREQSTAFEQCVADRAKYTSGVHRFEFDGIQCIITTVHRFNWNGYVILPSGHPDCKCNTNQLNSIYTVFNGISFAQNGKIGFSTVGPNDYCLLRDVIGDSSESYKPYRSFNFVMGQTQSLAKQVANRLENQYFQDRLIALLKNSVTPNSGERSPATPKPPSRDSNGIETNFQDIFITLFGIPAVPNSGERSPPTPKSPSRDSDQVETNFQDIFTTLFGIPAVPNSGERSPPASKLPSRDSNGIETNFQDIFTTLFGTPIAPNSGEGSPSKSPLTRQEKESMFDGLKFSFPNTDQKTETLSNSNKLSVNDLDIDSLETIDETEYTPVMRELVNELQGLGYKKVKLVRYPLITRTSVDASPNNASPNNASPNNASTEIKITREERNNDYNDYTDLPDLESDFEEESSESSSKDDTLEKNEDNEKNLNFYTLLALEHLLPGALDNLSKLKDGEKFCICGQCNKEKEQEQNTNETKHDETKFESDETEHSEVVN